MPCAPYACNRYLKCVSVPLWVQLIYLTFLAEFFLDDAGLDQLYYSEMRESGYFEDDYSGSY